MPREEPPGVSTLVQLSPTAETAPSKRDPFRIPTFVPRITGLSGHAAGTERAKERGQLLPLIVSLGVKDRKR